MKHETPIDLWLYEKEAFADGFQLVCGVDEAGRGPLAGPVCATAVILPPELVIPGLNDSKKLTDKKRRELCSVITAEASGKINSALLLGCALAMLVLAAMSVTTGSFAKAADARDAAQANHVAAEDVVWEMK